MDQLLEEASTWFARMRGPDAEAYRADFDAWLARGAAHLGAYNRAGEIFALGKFMTEKDGEDEAVLASLSPKWRLVAAAAMITLAAGAVLWEAQRWQTSSAPVPQIAAGAPALPAKLFRFDTGNGLTRNIALDDGSKITLAPGSMMSAKFDRQRRELHLDRGSARFEVAHEKRPFVVFAGGGSVTARGTIFDVILHDDLGVTVRLLRGAVDVERPARPGATAAPAKAVTRLEAGETFSFGVSEPPALALMSVERAGPASEGLRAPPETADFREFDQASLADVIFAANRGAIVPIRVASPAVGALRVSGRFRIDDPDRVAERLASLFDLRVERGKDRILLRAR
jgi:transmembrane sensor